MTDLIEDIRQALDSFDMEKARDLLREALKEPSADIYYLASLAALNKAQRENFLKQAVELDPFHEEATEALTNLKQLPNATQVYPSKELSVVSEEKTPKQEITSTPSSATTPATKDEPALVIGKLSGESRIILYQIPSTSGAQRTFMPGDSEVILLTRDENADWFNVVYTASTGQQLLGWAEAKDIHDISLLGNPIEIMDLPITQFEWNIREDIDDLIKIAKAKTPIPPGAVISIIIGVFVGLAGICATANNPEIGNIIIILVGLGLIVFGAVKIRDRSESDEENNALTVSRLKKIKASKKPESQKLMENQLITAAIQTGMNVGSTIITKMVPDKQEITHRNK